MRTLFLFRPSINWASLFLSANHELVCPTRRATILHVDDDHDRHQHFASSFFCTPSHVYNANNVFILFLLNALLSTELTCIVVLDWRVSNQDHGATSYCVIVSGWSNEQRHISFFMRWSGYSDPDRWIACSFSCCCHIKNGEDGYRLHIYITCMYADDSFEPRPTMWAKS